MTDKSWWATAPERFGLTRAYHDVAEVIGWDKAIDFGMTVWERKRPPSQRQANSVYGGGRGVIYIPEVIRGWKGRQLVEIAGEEDAERLSQAFGGESLEFACIAPAFRRQRDRAIRHQFDEGKSLKAIACLFDLTDRRVRDIVNSGPGNHVNQNR